MSLRPTPPHRVYSPLYPSWLLWFYEKSVGDPIVSLTRSIFVSLVQNSAPWNSVGSPTSRALEKKTNRENLLLFQEDNIVQCHGEHGKRFLFCLFSSLLCVFHVVSISLLLWLLPLTSTSTATTTCAAAAAAHIVLSRGWATNAATVDSDEKMCKKEFIAFSSGFGCAALKQGEECFLFGRFLRQRTFNNTIITIFCLSALEQRAADSPRSFSLLLRLCRCFAVSLRSALVFRIFIIFLVPSLSSSSSLELSAHNLLVLCCALLLFCVCCCCFLSRVEHPSRPPIPTFFSAPHIQF